MGGNAAGGIKLLPSGEVFSLVLNIISEQLNLYLSGFIKVPVLIYIRKYNHRVTKYSQLEGTQKVD